MRQFWDDFKATIFRWLCLASRRFKFKQICKAIGIKPYWWQKNFALSKNPILVVSGGRRSGKTMAVILRALMYDGSNRESREDILVYDPDYNHILHRMMWYNNEYNKYYKICEEAGIPLSFLPF